MRTRRESRLRPLLLVGALAAACSSGRMLSAQDTRPARRSTPDFAALREAGPERLLDLSRHMWRSAENEAKGEAVLHAWAERAVAAKGFRVVSGQPVPLPKVARLELSWGSGHGGTLHHVVGFPAGERVELRKLQFRRSGERYRTKWPPYVGTSQTERIYVSRPVYRTYLRYLAQLAATKLEKVPVRDAKGRRILGVSGSSSRDFWTRIRLREREKVLLGDGYVGYAGSSNLPRYAWLEAGRKTLLELWKAASPRPLPSAESRTEHFDALFRMAAKDAKSGMTSWWLRERLLQAAGQMGSAALLPELERALVAVPGVRTQRPRYYALRSILALTGIELREKDLRNLSIEDASAELPEKLERWRSEREESKRR